jgi:hypothetical protein
MHGTRHLQLPVVAQATRQPLAPAAYLRNVYVSMLVPAGGGGGGGGGGEKRGAVGVWAPQQSRLGAEVGKDPKSRKEDIGGFEEVEGVGGEGRMTIILPFLCR